MSAAGSGAREVAAGAAPLTAPEAALLLDASFAGNEHVVLAVSGGADSTALMVLAAEWRAARAVARPALSVVTVDHGLRPESAAEAAAVALRAHDLGLEHTTLAWPGPKPATGIQAAARDARYRLIGAHLAANRWPAVATAHTEDDQAETLLLRLARGSGIDGLAAMRPKSRREGMLVLRPLLGIPKARLVATLEARGLRWLEDPSNARLDFERVRLRAARTALDGIGLTSAHLALSARRLARASVSVAAAVMTAVGAPEAAVLVSPLGHAEVGWSWLIEQPPEVRLRILAGLLRAIGGRAEPISLGQLEAMTEGRDWANPAGRTFAGVAFVAGADDAVVMVREAGRQGLPELVLAAGPEALWDSRFAVSYAWSDEQPLTIRSLGPTGASEALAGRRPEWQRDRPPRRALEALPGFWHGGRLLAAPGLDYVAAAAPISGATARFIGKPFGDIAL